MISGELYGREHERRSLVAASGEGRARERVKLCEMRWGCVRGHGRGSKKGAGRVGGIVAEKLDDVHECACAGPR